MIFIKEHRAHFTEKKRVVSTCYNLLAAFVYTMQTLCPNFCSEVSILLEISLIQSGGALLQMEWRTNESVILCNLAKSNDIL